MKTPKTTPAEKSKLNTPRSGFIKKNKNSAKKLKLNAVSSEATNIDTPSKKKTDFQNKSPKKAIENSTFNNEKKSNNLSSRKRKASEELKISPTASPNKFKSSPKAKIKPSKASPEVQLGLDIEKFLDKNSKNKSPQSTPVLKQKNEINKSNKKIMKDSKNKKQLKKVKGNVLSTSPKNAIGKAEDQLVEAVTVMNAVNALIKFVDTNPKQKQEIFGLTVPLLVQFNFIKPPKINSLRISVPHSLVCGNSDVCLIISDKGKKKDSEELIDDMKEVLKKCGVSSVTEVVPWKKLLHDHTQYEQRKKFVNRFDFFLIENKLAKSNTRMNFPNGKKPIPIKLEPESKIKTSIEGALRKVQTSCNGVGLTRAIQFGHYKMGKEKLVNNLQAVLKSLCDETVVPGGKKNIRSIFIKTQTSFAFPIYVTTKSSNRVKAPASKTNNEEDEGVEGELSTFPGAVVKVFKDGTVKVSKKKTDGNTPQLKQNDANNRNKSNKKIKLMKENEELSKEDSDAEEDSEDEDNITKEEDSEDDYDSDGSELDGESEISDLEDNESFFNVKDGDNKEKRNKKKEKKLKEVEKNEASSDDEQLEEAEQLFLKELRKQQEEIESKGKKQLPQKTQQNALKASNKKKNKANNDVTKSDQPLAKETNQGKKNKQKFAQNKNTSVPNKNSTNFKENEDTLTSKKSKKRGGKNKQKVNSPKENALQNKTNSKRNALPNESTLKGNALKNQARSKGNAAPNKASHKRKRSPNKSF